MHPAPPARSATVSLRSVAAPGAGTSATAFGERPGAHLALPLCFVALYGSGFVGAKYGLPYSPPLTFLVLRFAIAALLAAGIALALRAPWPAGPRAARDIAIAGILTVATFSAGVFVAISLGLSPALSALIVALQPIIVAVVATRSLGEHLGRRQWLGLGLGLLGVALVVGHKVSFTSANALAVAMSVVALLGVSFGNLYQKRYCTGMNIFTGGAIQSGASCLVLLPLALLFEKMHVVWTGQFVAALAYMAIGVSIGALSLLYIMIRRGEVSRVASMFYLVPVSAAIVSYFLYHETFDLIVWLGVVITAFGVVLVNQQPQRRTA